MGRYTSPAVRHHSEAAYWEPADVDGELGRVFDICHGCRRCWNVCPSFGTLFKRIDAIEDSRSGPPKEAAAAYRPKPEGEHAAEADPSLASAANPVEGLTDADRRQVVDECYQCKLCYNLCPYHPPHRYQLDFPRLMQRAKAARVRREGIPLADRLFARVDLLGRLSCAAAGLVNRINRLPLARWFLEKTLGVHRKRDLPLFFAQTFRQWWDWRGPRPDADCTVPVPGERRVALFYTCSVNYNDPDTGKDAVSVLERNGLEVVCPTQRCCGMPLLDSGDVGATLAAARANVEALYPLARQGVPILALGPTCSFMLKEEYPSLLRTDEARYVAKRTYDIMEYLVLLKRQGRLDRRFAAGPAKIAYHAPCHLKAQNIGFKSKELLELLPGSAVTVVDRCSAHDGTWSMKEPYFELSMKAGGKLFEALREAAPDAVATDCPLAAVQIKQGTGLAPKHPIQWLAKAYGIPTDRP